MKAETNLSLHSNFKVDEIRNTYTRYERRSAFNRLTRTSQNCYFTWYCGRSVRLSDYGKCLLVFSFSIKIIGKYRKLYEFLTSALKPVSTCART